MQLLAGERPPATLIAEHAVWIPVTKTRTVPSSRIVVDVRKPEERYKLYRAQNVLEHADWIQLLCAGNVADGAWSLQHESPVARVYISMTYMPRAVWPMVIAAVFEHGVELHFLRGRPVVTTDRGVRWL